MGLHYCHDALCVFRKAVSTAPSSDPYTNGDHLGLICLSPVCHGNEQYSESPKVSRFSLSVLAVVVFCLRLDGNDQIQRQGVIHHCAVQLWIEWEYLGEHSSKEGGQSGAVDTTWEFGAGCVAT